MKGKTLTTSKSTVGHIVMCSDCGCNQAAIHERRSWVKRNGWLPICEKHLEFYNAVGLETRALKPYLNVSFGLRGRGKQKKKWVGKWYKPWTWRKYVYIIENIDIISIDIMPPLDFSNTE